MSVLTATLPQESLLHGYIKDRDFLDCYSCSSSLDVDAAAKAAMTFPGWVRFLLALRNIIVAPLGLSTTLHQGEVIGHFPIDKRNKNEIVLGFDDNHLDFRIAILKHEDRVYGATWVHTNNWLGKAYLRTIMPFHVLIMRNAMQNVVRQTNVSDY